MSDARRRGTATLESRFDEACAHYTDVGLEHLAEEERVLVTIWALEADVNNGGFDQFYFNSGGDLAFNAPWALNLVGAIHAADIVTRANAVFGVGGPPRDRTTRQTELFTLTDAHEDLFDELDREFYAYPDDLRALLIRYLGLEEG